jgi:hypothetical protein
MVIENYTDDDVINKRIVDDGWEEVGLTMSCICDHGLYWQAKFHFCSAGRLFILSTVWGDNPSVIYNESMISL